MALYHLHAKIISRGTNRTVMAASAYRSGTKLTLKFTKDISDKVQQKLVANSNKKYHIIDKETGQVIGLYFDYSKKKGVAYSGIIAPKNAPNWVLDREQLWQRIEEYEKRIDSRLSREIEFALQKELTPEQNLALAKDFINIALISRGLICDYNIHYDNKNKPHIHVLTVLRYITQNLNGNTEFSETMRDWGDNSLVNELRYELALITNKHFMLADLPYRVSHLSYDTLEIDLSPTKYEGVTRHIKGLRLAPRNDEIIRINAERIISNPEIIINKLGIDKPVFTTEDISRELKKALELVAEDKLQQVNQTALNKLVTRVMASPKIEVVNFNDLKDKILFARKDRLELERRLMKNVNNLANNKYHSLNISEDDLKIKNHSKNNILAGIELSKEQQDAIITLCNGTGISYLKGKPGTGKTTILKNFVNLATKHDYNIIATAPTNKGAMELEAALGIKVLNTAKLRKEWQEAKGFKFILKMALNYYQEKQYQSDTTVIDQNTIIIIDEASMLDLQQINYFISEIVRARAKIIIVGDDNQHKAPEFAGAATLIERVMQSKKLKIAELNEIYRHNNPDPNIRKAHRLATTKLSEFKIKEAFDIYQELGALNICDTEIQTKQAIVHEYVSEIINNIKTDNGIVGNLTDHIAAFKSVAIGCYTNTDVRYFNEKIRNHLKRCGILKGQDYVFKSGSGVEQRMVKIALGDQIIFESSKKKFKKFAGVSNREIAIVTKIYNCNDAGIGSFEARIIRKNNVGQDCLETVTIRTGEKIFPIKFNHGYALTSHIFQGAKMSKMLIYFEKYYESMMVLATRHVNELKIYIAKDIMENFVYRKKELDITKAREDYEIQAYAAGNKLNEDGEQESYPVYKIGSNLSSSQRADLNSSLSNNYSYDVPKKEQQYLQDLKSRVAETEDKMLEVRLELKKWLDLNSKKIRKNIARQFKLKSKEIIIIDPITVGKSTRAFKDKLILVGDNPVDAKELNLKMTAYLEQITSRQKSKINIVTKKPEWQKLAIDDQNLIIYNSLNKKSKSKLDNLTKRYNLHEKQIKIRSNAVEKYKLDLQQLAKSNKQLTGNHLIVNNYAESLKKLAEILKELESWQENYLSPSRQKIMQQKIAKNLHIDMTGVKFLKVNPYMLLSASRYFRKDYIQQYKEEIKYLQRRKTELSKNPNENKLAEYQKINKRLDKIMLTDNNDLAKAITDYLKDIALKNLDNNSKLFEKNITWNNLKSLDQHLIISNLLSIPTIKKLKLLFTKKQQIQQQLTKNAKIISENYEGFARPDLTAKLEEKQQQLEQENLSRTDNKTENNKLLKEISRLTKQIKDASSGISGNPLQMKMKDVLNSQNLNFETVRMHAKKTDYKFYFENVTVKPSLLENNKFSKEFVNLLQNMLDHRNMSRDKITQEELNNSSIKLNLVKEFIKSQQKQLAIVRGEIASLKSEYDKDMEKISDLEYEQNIAFPEYLSNLFKEDSNAIIKQFHQKITARTREEVIRYIYSDKFVSKIGKLKTSRLERSFFGKAMNDYKWRGDRENLRYVQDNFIDYIDSKIELDKLQSKWQQRNCAQENRNLQARLNNYKEIMPNSQEQELLHQLDQISKPISENNNQNNLTQYIKILQHKDTTKILNTYKRQRKRTDIAKYLQILTTQQKEQGKINDPWMIYHRIPGDVKELNLTEVFSKEFLEQHQFVTKYEYRSKYGQLLGYNLLFHLKGIDYNDKPIEKLIPLTYGYNKDTKVSSWISKIFTDNGKTAIYGAEKLANNDKTVLLVQGEKIADRATELLPEYTIISWCGNKDKIPNINWSELQGKNIVILPKNSKDGKEAGHQLQFALTFSGINSYVIDTESASLATKLKTAENSKDSLLEEVKIADIKLLIKKGEYECGKDLEPRIIENNEIIVKEATTDKALKSELESQEQESQYVKDER